MTIEFSPLRPGTSVRRPGRSAVRIRSALTAAIAIAFAPLGAEAQAPGAGGPPAVGVVRAVKTAITETDEFIGRVQSINEVTVVPRLTAFLTQRHFVEGSEVKAGDLLYTLEQPPFQAAVQAQEGAVAQTKALLENARLTLARQRTLLNTPAGQQSNVDTALAQEQNYAAQVVTAEANLKTAQINLGYTEIRSPIDGKIGATDVTEGNVVTPSSGTLTTIVSQDPMYITFPVSVRAALDLREKFGAKGFNAVAIRIRLPNGRMYGQTGNVDFINNTIDQNVDTITLRGTIPNPFLPGQQLRELVDGEFVTVLLEGVQPVEMLGIPRAAVLSDTRGDYVFTVGPDNKVVQTRIVMGQSTPTVATVSSGLTEGELVILEGIQRVRPGMVVKPGPASQPPGSPALLPGATVTPAGGASGSPADGTQKPSGSTGTAPGG